MVTPNSALDEPLYLSLSPCDKACHDVVAFWLFVDDAHVGELVGTFEELLDVPFDECLTGGGTFRF